MLAGLLRLAGVVLLTLCVAVPRQAFAADTQDALRLSLDDARRLAAVALSRGDAALARDLAMGLLKADAEDPYAYAVLARAHSRLGNPSLARSAARLTYRYSDDAGARYDAARAAGRLALAQDRPTAAQIWLRRAALHSRSPAQDAALARDYRVVRRVNPWSLRVDARIAPSDNVNNGANSALEVINGEPTFGVLGPSSQALSGVVATFDIAVGYRLRQSATSATTLGHRLYSRQVSLSSEAKDTAPLADADDFAATYADLSLQHAFALGASGNSAAVATAAGAAWTAGDRIYDFVRIEAQRRLRFGPGRTLVLSGAVERREAIDGPQFDQDLARVGIAFSQTLARGDKLTLSYSLQDIDSDSVNNDYTTDSLRAEYQFAQRLGPAQVAAGLTVGRSDYDAYTLIGPVDGGREDRSAYGDLTFVFDNYDVAGFAPTLRLRTGGRTSNISRFETSQTSLSLEIRSKF